MNKKKSIIVMLFTCLISSALLTEQEFGSLPKEKKVGNLTYRKKLNYICDQADYIRGGITFNYPAHAFSAAPMVNVSITINCPFDPDVTWSPVITANDISGVTIGVTRSCSIERREATTNEVAVSIYAIGQP